MSSIEDLGQHADQAVAAYRRVHDDYVRCAAKISDLLTDWLDEEKINYQAVTARAKTVASFRTKAERPRAEGSSTPKYADPMSELTDLLAARVITYLPETVDRVCAVMEREFDIVEQTDKGQITKDRGLFGYASKHYLVRLGEARAALVEYAPLRGKTFEIQVRTAAQHAWAEFEHDVRYKVTIPVQRRPEFDRRFLLAAALVEMADNEFTAIETMFRELAAEAAQHDREQQVAVSLPSHHDEQTTTIRPLDVPALMNWCAGRYPDASKSKVEHYRWILDILTRLEVTDADQLDAALTAVDSDQVAAIMAHTYPPGQVRRLDDDLLAAYRKAYLQAQPEGEPRRPAVLRSRLKQLNSGSASLITRTP